MLPEVKFLKMGIRDCVRLGLPLDNGAKPNEVLAAIAALEKACTDRERCGNCKYGTNRYSHARFWVANCGAGLHPNGFVKAHDRCHFITPEHPHGRWELCDE